MGRTLLLVRPFFSYTNMNMIKIHYSFFIIGITFLVVSCKGCSPQDSPQSIAETYAQSLCDMDIEGLASCYEYGEEMLSFVDEEISDFSFGDIQRYVGAAKESQLLPDITYEIVEEKIDGDKGVIRIRFDSEFDDGEEVHKESNYETISVYCHEGQWWVGDGYSKKDREMGRRFMNFIDKVR